MYMEATESCSYLVHNLSKHYCQFVVVVCVCAQVYLFAEVGIFDANEGLPSICGL